MSSAVLTTTVLLAVFYYQFTRKTQDRHKSVNICN